MCSSRTGFDCISDSKFLFCSSSKQDQVVYSGPVREKEDVKKDLNSIGPKVIQTFTVS